eukprot:UN14941
MDVLFWEKYYLMTGELKKGREYFWEAQDSYKLGQDGIMAQIFGAEVLSENLLEIRHSFRV